MQKSILFVVAAGFLAFAVSVNAALVTYSGEQELSVNQVEKQVGQDQLLIGQWARKNASTDYRSHLQFDLSGIENEGATVESATLKIYLDGRNSDGWGTTDLYVITESWATGDTVSELWNVSVSNPGIQVAPAQPTVGIWYDMDVTDIVQGWRDSGGSDNFGFSLRTAEGYAATGKSWSSSSSASNNPTLEATYIPEPSTFGILALFGIVALLRRKLMKK